MKGIEFFMKILAIDTATEVCSVALLENETTIDEITITSPNSHSVELMPLINNIISNNNLTLNDIDLFACDNGPGSFTGIRIGIATIKAFCDVTSKNCIGISSLEGFARKIKKNNTIICSLINANHGNCYCGFFYYENNDLKVYEDYFFDSFSNILDKINKMKKNIFFVGNCGIVFKDMIESKCLITYEINPDTSISAVDIGKSAFQSYDNNVFYNSNSLIPLYLK